MAKNHTSQSCGKQTPSDSTLSHHPSPAPKSLSDLTHSLAYLPGNALVADAAGIIRYVNRQTLSSLGFKQTDMIGQAMTDFWDQPGEASRDILAQLKRDHFWQGKIKQRTKNHTDGRNGKTVWELVSLAIIACDEGTDSYIIQIGQPIAPPKADKPEDRLSQSEMDLQAVMNSTPYAIGIFRLSDRKIVEVNSSYCQHTGYRREEIVGRTAMDLGLYRDLADREVFVETFDREGRVDDMELDFVTKTGEVKQAVISARGIHFRGEACGITSSMDVTELRKTQRALEESELLYRTLMEATPENIVLTRLDDGKITHANNAFFERSGWRPEECIGRTTTDLNIYVDPQDRKKFVDILRQEGRVDAFEVPVHFKDGVISIEMWSARTIEIFGEQHLVVVTRDISELVTIRQALEESERNYRTILETSPLSVAVLCHSDLRYVLVNAAYTRDTGYSQQESIGKRMADLNLFENPVAKDRFLEMFKAQSFVDGMELRFRKKDGGITESLVSARPIQYGNERCILMVATNIDQIKEMQNALAERETSYRTILETAPYSIVIHSIKSGAYVEVNDAFLKISGFSKEELIGRTPEELNFYITPEDHQRLIEALKPDGRVNDMEMKFRVKDGSVHESLLSTNPIRYQGQWCLLTIIVDISAQKQAQRKLAESEASYRTIMESAPYSIIVTRLRDNRYMQVNNAFCRRMGYSREEAVGKTPYDLGTFVDPTAREQMLTIFRREGRVDSMDLQFRAKDGSIRESLFSVTPITYQGEACLLAMTVDVSEQKAAERALRRSEQKYRNVLVNMEEGYWETDLKGNLTFVNEAESRIHRCPPEKLIGKNNRDYTSPETAKKVFRIFDTVFRTGEPAMLNEYEMTREDGTIAIIETSVSLHKDEHGSPIGFYGIARDITEKKKAANELDKYRKHLEEMVRERTRELESAQNELLKRERLSVLGQLTATVSHELRNPLGVIRSSNFYLHRRVGAKDEKIDKHFKRIEEQVNLCDLIVADLLEYTRGRSVALENRPMAPWLIPLIDELEETQNVTIEKRFPPTLPPIPHDQEKMRRVFINLLENAIQAVQARAEVQAQTGEAYRPKVRVSATHKSDKVVIEVRDNGIGMDETTREHAFEPLFTTRAKGTGIGLANVQKIVSEHKGEVIIFSEPSNGTVVTLKLLCTIE